jgi:integral membrane sensor domain MASE1
MAFECNIDARGKAARLRTGILAVVGGLFLAGTTALGILPTNIGLVLAGSSIFGGLFAMWEARMGWCVIRAMGFKTPL